MAVRTGWLWRAENPHLNGRCLGADTLLALEDELPCISQCEKPRKALVIPPSQRLF